MTIEFANEIQTASFYSPLADFDSVEIEVEVREDPLTGRTARIVPDNFLLPEEEPDIEGVVADTEGCFFCPDRVEAVTPTYPDWVGEDRGRRGEAVSFPNLHPYGPHSNVVVLTEAHYHPIDAFSVEQFADGLGAAIAYLGAVFDHDDSATVASVNMNFLRPAGSSIVHPHLQTLADGRGTNEQRRRRAAARAYREATGASFWEDLLDAERGGSRHVGTTGSVEWLAPYAPIHHRHLKGVADYTGLPSPGHDVVEELADGLVRVLEYYGDVGLNSFNFALSLAEGRRPTIDVIARSVFEAYFWSDSPFFVTLHREGVVDIAPEEYAAAAGAFF